MVVPSDEVGYAVDSIRVLEEMDGPLARWAYESWNKRLDPRRRLDIQRPLLISDAEVARFERSCARLGQQAVASLRESVRNAGLERCAQLSVLLGQHDLQYSAVTVAPNAFAPELELIAAVAVESARSSRWRIRDDIAEAMRALRLARRARIYRQSAMLASAMATGSGRSRDVGLLFEVESLSIRGKFSTAHDYRYIRRLVAKMNTKGVTVPGPDGVAHITQVFVQAWANRMARLVAALPNPSRLREIIGTQSLLSHGDAHLGKAERKVLRRLLPGLSLTKDEILAGLPDDLRADVARWLDALSLPHMAGSGGRGNADVGTFFASSPLTQHPILHGADGYLLALTHRLSSDLSAMNDAVWGGAYGETYHRARAETVEELALESIAALADSPQIIHQANYASADRSVHGEVDGVVVWHDVCIILEGKGAFLSLAARRGSAEAVISDMRQSVGDGYFQAARLIRIVSEDGRAILRTRRGRELVLDGKELRRAYIVVPTADDHSVASACLTYLWQNRILPDRSTPLIVSVQELLKLAEITESFHDFVAYLDFREEVLLNRWIEPVDEMEILGAFAGGIDIVGECVVALRGRGFTDDFRSRHSRHIVCPAPMQEERHLRPWMVRKYGRTIDGDPAVPPPRRHLSVSAEQLRLMWERRRDLQALTAATAVAPEELVAVLGTSEQPRSRQPTVRRHHNVTAVSFRSRTGLTRAVQHPTVQSAACFSRYVIFIEHDDDDVRLAHVERGTRHACFRSGKVSFALRSQVPIHDPWFVSFGRRRRKPFDHAVAAALESDGVPRDLAVGVARLDIAEPVRALAALGADINKAAALWLEPIRTVAATLDTALDAFPLSPSSLRDVLGLVETGALPTQHVPALMEAMIRTGESAAQAATANNLLLGTHDDLMVRDTVLAVVARHPDAVAKIRAGQTRVIDFLIGQVIRNLDHRPDVGRIRSLLSSEITRLSDD